jgi:glycogen(starch) synthase
VKILLFSYFFHPSVGGIEQVSLTLAKEFVAVGHEVKVITTTRAGNEDRSFPFTVDRRPSVRRLFELTRWCDVYFHNNISLQYVWPLLILRRPWVIAHHTWIARKDESIGWQDRVKQIILRFGTDISISRPVANHLSTPSLVIGNPYQDHLFRRDPEAERNRALIFVGRLGEEKGVHFLLESLRQLREQGLRPELTIVGSGPEERNLQELAVKYALTDQVNFTGTLTGSALVALLNRHKIMVVPSRWHEPFGLVALEGRVPSYRCRLRRPC